MNDQLITLIRDRKSQLSKFTDMLRNEKFYQDTIQISNNVDMLVQRSQIDVHLFLKRILIFGIALNSTLEIKNSSEKLKNCHELCKQFRDYIPQPLSQKDEIKYILQTTIQDAKLNLLTEFQVIQKQMKFANNLSFKSVTIRFIQLLDLVYNAFADSIFLGDECQDYIRKCDAIVNVHIIQQIKQYIEMICSYQFEEEVKYLLDLNGIVSNFDSEII